MTQVLATTEGKEHALECLRKRREENAGKDQINNASLYAGSPMYYYCKSCSGLAEVLPESHISSPKQLCDECQDLEDRGWLE